MEPMPQSRVTIPQLAAELGLSVGTVSSALNNKPSVAESTRTRVHEAAARLGYLHNRSAAALRRGRTGILSLHLPANTSDLQFYMNFAFGLSSVVAREGYDVLLDHEHSRANPLTLVDAAIVVDWSSDLRTPSQLARAGIPIFAVDGIPSPDAPATKVISTNYAALTVEIAERAISKGAHKAALLSSSSLPGVAWQRDVHTTLEAACTAHGIPLAHVDLAIGTPANEVAAAIKSLIDREQPDLLVSTGERWAGIANLYLQLGEPDSSVPWLVSTAGDPITELSSPHITAFDLMPYEYGRHCGDLVVAFLDGEGATADRNEAVWDARINWARHWSQPLAI